MNEQVKTKKAVDLILSLHEKHPQQVRYASNITQTLKDYKWQIKNQYHFECGKAWSFPLWIWNNAKMSTFTIIQRNIASIIKANREEKGIKHWFKEGTQSICVHRWHKIVYEKSKYPITKH